MSDTPLAQAREQEIRARCDAATPGPWVWDAQGVMCAHPDGMGGPVLDAPIGVVGDSYPRGVNHPSESMEFIAHARADIPWLLDQLAEARALVAAAEAKGRAEERARCEPLRQFAKQMLDGARLVDFVADGGSTQDLGERLGLIVATRYDTPCEDGCTCAADYGSDEFPLTCYKDGPLLASPTTEEAQG